MRIPRVGRSESANPGLRRCNAFSVEDRIRYWRVTIRDRFMMQRCQGGPRLFGRRIALAADGNCRLEFIVCGDFALVSRVKTSC
jgi:hypothetical protein